MASDCFAADLHLHTNASDGARSPQEMIALAGQAKMTCVSVTDHDTAAAVVEAMETGSAMGLRVIPGIELSAGQGEEVHLLGYGFDPMDPGLLAFLASQLAARRARTTAILQKLAALGISIPPEETSGRDASFMGRMHLADAMIRRGIVGSVEEAFARYLGEGKPAFVPRERIPVSAGIEALRSFHACVVLAHPGRLRMGVDTLLTLLPEWMEAGLDGLEAYHASHSAEEAERYDRMARRRGLLVTGGSDSHGRAEGAAVGANLSRWRTAQSDVDALEERIKNYQ